MIRELITAFPDHLRQALEIGRSATLTPANQPIKNVLITGLGGSGIGGKIASVIAAPECPIPIAVNNNYHLPKWVNQDTLVIACSYSGNTEETIQAVEIAIEAGAQIACITTGGRIKEMADTHGWNQINVPPGMPPRQAFGFTFPQLFFLFRHYGLISDGFESHIEAVINSIDASQKEMEADAGGICDKLSGTIPFLYSAPETEGVVVRFRQQLNENSKMLACHHIFPEMNHNELVGWSRAYNNVAIVMFRNENDFARTQKRMEVCNEIFGRCTDNIIELWSKGDSDLERALYMIHFGDWITLLLAEKNNIDPFEIESINHLKNELAKV